MISLDTQGMTDEVRALVRSFGRLERHIAKRHLKASIARAMKDAIPVLRSVTPPVGVTKGRKKKGEKRSSGKLRRSVTTRGKYSKDMGAVYGVAGYRYSDESRKAIWINYGTKNGVRPRRMILAFLYKYRGPTEQKLREELKIGLERAARDLCPPADFYRRGGRTS